MPAQDAFIFDGIRTPIGRYGGALSSIRADDLAALPLGEMLRRNPGLDPNAIDEVILGCANQSGEDNRNVARMASLLAGLPVEVPALTVNRLCASGLDAVGYGARAIASGEAGLIIAGGVESMSRAPFVMPKADAAFSRSSAVYDTTIGWRFINPRMRAAYGVDSMPETADNVAEDYAVSRVDQDDFAYRSQQRWAAAEAAGWFRDEIMPVEIAQKRGAPSIFERDEHPRPDVPREKLSALRGINGAEKSVTAGNASGVNDGAAALLIGARAAGEACGLTPRARILGTASSGVAPRIMGIGPVTASQKLLARLGLSITQMDVIELNEAFAAQALATLRALGVADDAPHVNPHGGAIAMGHPLGMSGTRIVLAALRALERRQGRYALVTLCVGVGQGVAMVIERC